ncbi:DNA mismatch repair protein MutS, partial [Clostridium saudiense]|nr:DNA mismatch repair protein MutS [Clostridium saudiense]
YNIIDFMTIDSNSRRNLELTESLKEKSKKGSLIWVLDKTSTSMGGRTLRSFIEQPLINKSQIENRSSAVEELYNNMFFNEELRESLREIYDIERITGKISNKNVNAKDLVSLKKSLDKLPGIKEKLINCKSDLLVQWNENLDTLDDIRDLLNESLLEDPSIGLKEG